MPVSPFPAKGARQSHRRASQSGWAGRVDFLVLFLWALPVLFMLFALLYRSTMFVSRSYNEGWNAYYAKALFDGTALYHPAGSLITNNYPPLSFLIVSLVMHLVPDAVFAGRLVATISFLAVTGLIGAILRRVDGDNRGALVGSLVFATYACVNFTDYIGTDDPQFLSLAVILSAFYLQIRFMTARWSGVLTAIIVTLGIFIKHNSIALPITMAIWLLLQSPFTFARFAVAGALSGFAGLAISVGVFGPNFLSSLLAPRQFSVSKALHQSLDLITPMKPLILLAGVPALLPGRDRFGLLIGGYVAISLAIGCLTSGGEGVGFNSMFEVAIALSLAAGHVFTRLSENAHPSGRAIALAGIGFAAVWSGTLFSAMDMFSFKAWRAQQLAKQTRTLAAVQFISSHPGRALCATPVLCYWAGKPHEVDPYNFDQAVAAGKADQAILINAVKEHAYATVELYPIEGYSFFSPAVWRAVKQNYDAVPIELAGSAFFSRPGSPNSIN